MIVIENDIIPLKGYAAVTIWPFVFVRNGTRILNEVDINDFPHVNMSYLIAKQVE
jgi:hypothetical protein